MDLYYGLLEEREREVDSLKQQLEDVNTAVELKERKTAALKELVIAGSIPFTQSLCNIFSGTSTSQQEMGVPTWTPSDVSTFFVKDEKDNEPQPEKPVKRPEKFVKKAEVPGIAFVSLLVVLSRVTGGVWNSTMRHVPKEIKALV